jgi:hypothetical protein
LNNRRSPDIELARAPQVRVDPRLPTLAGLAIGLHDIFIEPQRDRGLRLAGQRRPPAPDQPVAVAQLAAAKEIIQQFRCVIGIIGQRFAEVFCASAFPPTPADAGDEHQSSGCPWMPGIHLIPAAPGVGPLGTLGLYERQRGSTEFWCPPDETILRNPRSHPETNWG